jgi:tetratricopeptide (TPR) repeat protein
MNFKYNIALIHLKQHNYQSGLSILETIISQDPQYKKTVYLFAVISAKHIQNLDKAIEYADRGIELYKSFVDLIFYRGKIRK